MSDICNKCQREAGLGAMLICNGCQFVDDVKRHQDQTRAMRIRELATMWLCIYGSDFPTEEGIEIAMRRAARFIDAFDSLPVPERKGE